MLGPFFHHLLDPARPDKRKTLSELQVENLPRTHISEPLLAHLRQLRSTLILTGSDHHSSNRNESGDDEAVEVVGRFVGVKYFCCDFACIWVDDGDVQAPGMAVFVFWEHDGDVVDGYFRKVSAQEAA